MKALILKDFLNLKQMAKSQLLGIIFVLAIGLYLKDISYISGLLIMMSFNYSLTCFSYDEKSNFYSYGLALPLSRKKIVVARYLVAYIILIAMTLLTVIINKLITSHFVYSSSPEFMLMILTLISMALFSISTILPLIFKNGVEKTRIYLFGFLFLPIMLLIFFKDRLGEVSQIQFTRLITIILPLMVLIMNLISIKISISIMDKKDF